MRKEEKTERTKERILVAAMDEFGSKGYAASSLNNICNAGISKGLLYHNFENKDELFLACVRQCFHSLSEYLKSKNVGTDIQKYTAARLSFFREHENESRIFFDSILQPPDKLKKDIEKARTEFDSFNQSIYEHLLNQITLRPGVTRENCLQYLKLMQNMFNGYFSSPAIGNLSFSETLSAHEKELPKLFDFILYGIAEQEKQK